jgi:sugar transferase (PEP-CTERM/EpsH1 system associated)
MLSLDSAMMNIMHVVLNLKVGGLERFILELIKNYSNEVTSFVVCLEEAGDLADYIRGGKVIALNQKPGLKYGAVPEIMKLIRENNIQLVHTHNEAAHFYGALAGKLSGVPVVHTRHGRYLHNSRRKVFLAMFSSFLATKIVGVSKDVSDLIARKEKIPDNKVLTILNGVDVDHYSPCAKKVENNYGHEIGNRCINIGIVARLDRVKDHSTLLITCNELRKFNDNFRLIIVGDGAMRSQLEKEVELLHLHDKVDFKGTRHDIVDIMNDLDIFALSSTSEGISLTLLEAMSCCLPVVATNVGGNPEVVKDGETGFLVPPKNPELFSEKLLMLIQDKKIREKMGVAGRERVMQHFSISQTAKKYVKLYTQVQMNNTYA